jgi:hypothetical protein
VNESVEEYLPVALRQNERLMPGDGSLRRFGENRQAKIGQAAAFELGRSYYDLLRLTVHTDADASAACAVFFAGCSGPSMGHTSVSL